MCRSISCLWKGARPISGLNQPPREGRISELAKDIHRRMEAYSCFVLPRRVVFELRDVTARPRGNEKC